MIDKEKTIMPTDAVVAVTYRCNSRCIMCNIWQIKNFPEMPAEEYHRLPSCLKDINISGGEPFLRQDLPEVVKAIKKACPKAHLGISTNGFLVNRIKEILPEIKKIAPNISISISIDGVGQMHEQVRRVHQAWPKVLETIRFCRDIAKIKKIQLAFTLNQLNYKQLADAYRWSKRLGIGFTMAIAHSSDVYFGKKNDLKSIPDWELQAQFSHVIKGMLKSFNPVNWAWAYFVDGLYRVARGGRRPLESFAGEDFFYLDPRGDIYPSVIDNIKMGNIKDYPSFKTLWTSDQAKAARAALKGFESNYWMICTARSAFFRNPLAVMKWAFKRKVGIKNKMG